MRRSYGGFSRERLVTNSSGLRQATCRIWPACRQRSCCVTRAAAAEVEPTYHTRGNRRIIDRVDIYGRAPLEQEDGNIRSSLLGGMPPCIPGSRNWHLPCRHSVIASLHLTCNMADCVMQSRRASLSDPSSKARLQPQLQEQPAAAAQQRHTFYTFLT